jgi:hypothetical protein
VFKIIVERKRSAGKPRKKWLGGEEKQSGIGTLGN